MAFGVIDIMDSVHTNTYSVKPESVERPERRTGFGFVKANIFACGRFPLYRLPSYGFYGRLNQLTII